MFSTCRVFAAEAQWKWSLVHETASVRLVKNEPEQIGRTRRKSLGWRDYSGSTWTEVSEHAWPACCIDFEARFRKSTGMRETIGCQKPSFWQVCCSRNVRKLPVLIAAEMGQQLITIRNHFILSEEFPMRVIAMFCKILPAVLFLVIAVAAEQKLQAQLSTGIADPTPDAQVQSDAIDWSQIHLWTPSGRTKTFVDPQTRSLLKQIDIVDRPNRPLHFYGNAVRRRQHGRTVELPASEPTRRTKSAQETDVAPIIQR